MNLIHFSNSSPVAAACAAYRGRVAQYIFFLLLFPHSPQPIRACDPLFPFNISKDFEFNFCCGTHSFISQDKKKSQQSPLFSHSLSFIDIWFISIFSGRLISENIYASRQEVLVEKHKNDDHNWCHCADRDHPHHPLRYKRHLKPSLKQSGWRMSLI